MAEGGMKVVKYCVFFFNFIFWLCGLALIIVGAVVQVEYYDYAEVTGNVLTSLPIYVIIIGCFIMVVGFLGCCGAVKENYCMVTTFAVLLALILLLEIVAVILGYVYQDQVAQKVTDGLLEAIDKYADDEVIQKEIDGIQEKFECCGAENYTDWAGNTLDASNNSVPDSCCINDTGCNTAIIGAPKEVVEANIYTENCVDAFEDFIVENMAIVAGIGIAVAVIQLLGVICACCLMRSIKSGYEVV